MKRITLITAIAAIALPGLVHAQSLGIDTPLGTTPEEVRTSLTDMGYDVRKTETEDGRIEVYFVRGTVKGEAYVSRETGKIVKLEME